MKTFIFSMLIGGKADETHGVFTTFFARAHHLGEAWDKVREAAITEGIRDPVLLEAGESARLKNKRYEFEYVRLAQSIWRLPVDNLYPLDDPETGFVTPLGVVPAESNDDLPLRSNFAIEVVQENRFMLELAASRDEILPALFKAVRLLPDIVGLGIGIAHHWDDDLNEFWMNKTSFKSAQDVESFLNKERLNTLGNGYLDLVVFARDGDTRLILNEHKILEFDTPDKTLFSRFVAACSSWGFERLEKCVTIEFDHFHWHYRPGASLNRKAFIKFLKTQGFELKDKWENKR